MRVAIIGNSGSGKSTLARRLSADRVLPMLDLDTVAWEPDKIAVPRDQADAKADVKAFGETNKAWVIEGCYGDLIEAALPCCTELLFLNPGVEACVAHCHQRPWEPQKFASPKEQDALLKQLVLWVKEYETRDDEYGLKRHRKIFEEFKGAKREFTSET